MSRTPGWWRALPTWAQALWLSAWLPGAVAHELTHALVARPWGAARLNWDEVACDIEWDGDDYLGRAVAAIAPLVVGSALTVGLWLTVAGRPGSIIGLAVSAYAILNLAIYTVASAVDLHRATVYAYLWYRQRTSTGVDHA
ncbi:hypothetical protein [Haloplanus halophilus]|uniref:hypothetical protein n=1 Tax=Haloplanus halophilus TaxID=2949993 RepID=UPI0020402409|nr:hypothetical protein [Haloplanus sp. GDY1]